MFHFKDTVINYNLKTQMNLCLKDLPPYYTISLEWQVTEIVKSK